MSGANSKKASEAGKKLSTSKSKNVKSNAGKVLNNHKQNEHTKPTKPPKPPKPKSPAKLPKGPKPKSPAIARNK